MGLGSQRTALEQPKTIAPLGTRGPRRAAL
jgi:hypothetical protein